MDWVARKFFPPPKVSILAELARRVALVRPDSPMVKLALANKELVARKYAKAAKLFEDASEAGLGAHIPWSQLSRCYSKLGDKDAALKACQRGLELADQPDYDLHMQTGHVLAALGRRQETREHFLVAAEAGNYHEACWYILTAIAHRAKPEAIIEECDALEARFGQSAVFRANRAIALSRLAERAKASALVDLERHVRVTHISEVIGGGIEMLNAELAKEALTLASDIGSDEESVTSFPDLPRSRAKEELQAAIRAAVEGYLAAASDLGLDRCLPLPINNVCLSTGGAVLRGNRTYGQHIHLESVISVVYHLDSVGGALQIGPVDQYAGGHKACWGERLVPPQPGQLTIFPAHFFHDVIPTRSDRLRISIPSDVYLTA